MNEIDRLRAERSQQQFEFQAQITTLSVQNVDLEAQLQHSQEELEQTKTLLEESETRLKQEERECMGALIENNTHLVTIERLKGKIRTVHKQAESQRQTIEVRDEQVQQQSAQIEKLNREMKDRDDKIEGFKRAWEAMSGVMKQNN